MNQLINHTEQQIEKINPNDVSGTLKGLVPRSFEKTFNGLTTKQVEYAFSLCIQGLTREQIATGMSTVVENGYCPDPAMFRKWCLGVKGFVSDVDPVASSYRGKFAAIANIEAWLSDSSTLITNAEREAYNRVYGMFDKLKWADNYEKAKYYAYKAFEDAYSEVVKELVSKGEKQSIWDATKAIEKKREDVIGISANYPKTTSEVNAYTVSRRGFKCVTIEIKKSDVFEYMQLNGMRVFTDAENKLKSLEIKKIDWIAE